MEASIFSVELGQSGFVLRFLLLAGQVLFIFVDSMIGVIVSSFRSQFSSVVCALLRRAKADTYVVWSHFVSSLPARCVWRRTERAFSAGQTLRKHSFSRGR